MRRIFLLPVALATMLIGAGLAAADDRHGPFDFAQGREITFQSTDGVHSGRKDASDYSLTFVEGEKPRAYTLVLDGANPGEGWSLEVNGEELSFDPVASNGTLWFYIPAEAIQSGENTLAVSYIQSFRDVLLMPLADRYEEEHFGFFAKGSTVKAQPAVDSRQEMMDVLHCDLSMNISMASNNISAATLVLTAESLDSSLAQCVLDLNDNGGALVVSSVDDGASNPLTFTHNGSTERLIINLPAAVPAGNQFTVRVNYSGTPAGGYFRTTHSGTPLIYTYSQPYDARLWWPCKDIPADKFTIDSHLTVPDTVYNGYAITPVTNGKLMSTVNNGNGTITFNWRESFPVASYLVSICCTNYRPATGTYTALDTVTTMDMIHYLYPENYAAAAGEVANTINVIEYFAETFGEYPFLTEKYSTAGWNISSGMEHQTCTSMPDANLADAYHRRNIHELAHMWFGDMVTYRTYNHLWLAEGWATYAEALTYGHLSGDGAYHSYVNGWSVSDSRPVISPNQDAFDSLTFPTAYRKGAWVLHMLRHYMGDTDFFQATRDYLSSVHQYGTADSADFQTFYDAVAGEDLSWFFDQWLTRASRPDYQWAWSTHTQGGNTFVDLSILQVQADSVYIMPIDFEAVLSNSTRIPFTVTNDQLLQNYSVNIGNISPATVASLEFDPVNWLLDYNSGSTVSGAPSDAPILDSVVANAGAGEVTLAWEGQNLAIDGFRIYQSANGTSGWTEVANEATLASSVSSATLGGFSPGSSAYFRLVEVRGGLEGPYSDMYGFGLGTVGGKCLIVDGYDRWTTQAASGGLNHNFAAIHGRAVATYGSPFNSCANEAVGATINLSDYPIVIWVLGDESTTDSTFTLSEQSLVEAYLDQGGRLFVTGNEIGWDLGRPGVSSTADVAFYNDFLKAVFESDNSGVYTATGSGGASIFGTDVYTFGSGDAPYTPGFPDEVSPGGGGVSALEYGPGVLAGVQYFGTFGSKGTSIGGVVYLGFSFETVSSEGERNLLMSRVLDAFQPAAGLAPDFWAFY